MSVSTEKGQKLYKRGKKVIPGGTGLLSKRPEMYLPEQWPCYYSNAQGAELTDLDGNHFLDFTTNGVGSCILGYAHPDINLAVFEAYQNGNMSTLNVPEEVYLAEELINLHPWADMVRFARTGGETCSIAARIARAATNKTKIIICGYHGWHDWYLGVNLDDKKGLDDLLLPGLEPTGVPNELSGLVIPFSYGDLDELEAIFSAHEGEIAAVFMEPCRNSPPAKGFLPGVRRLCDKNDAVLIFDEITTGFREVTSGIHIRYGVSPDIAVFGKTISNGTPMSAILGVSSVMEASQNTFISSAYFTERSGPAAAMKTLQLHNNLEVGPHVEKIGSFVQREWKIIFEKYKIDAKVAGLPSLANYGFREQNAEKLTFIIQDMMHKGFLVTNQFYPTLAHTHKLAESYLSAFEETIEKLCKHLEENSLEAAIQGPVKHSTFARLL